MRYHRDLFHGIVRCVCRWLGPAALILLLLPMPLAAEVPPAAEETPVVRNGDTPAAGREELVLQELWRVDADDQEVLLGVIRDVMQDADGRVYLLDSQLSQIHVFSAAGDYLESLSREGEGPGECRQPVGMFFVSAEEIGIVQSFPGKIIKIDAENTPRGTIEIGGNDPAAGGFRFMRNVRHRGETFAYFGGEMKMGEDGFKFVSVLITIGADGAERGRLLEHVSGDPVETRRWIEAEEYFIDEWRWDIGPGGNVYAAPIRDRYAIEVFAPGGAKIRTIERAYEPRKRTRGEKAAIEVPEIYINGEILQIKGTIDDYDPCISRLHVNDAGELWVTHAGSTREQPEDILQAYDVFDPAGIYVRQVAIACPGDPETDRLFDIGGGRFVLIRGYVDDFDLNIGEGSDSGDVADLEETIPLEVICYAAVR
jgi:hypothetical protein